MSIDFFQYFLQARCAAPAVGDSFAGVLTHFHQPHGGIDERADGFEELLAGPVTVKEEFGGSGLLKGFGIAELVVVGGEGEGIKMEAFLSTAASSETVPAPERCRRSGPHRRKAAVGIS